MSYGNTVVNAYPNVNLYDAKITGIRCDEKGLLVFFPEGLRRSESGGREEMTVFFCILETATYNPSVSYADSSLCTREPK